MDSTVLAAIIGGVCTVTAGLLGVIVPAMLKRQKLFPISPHRQLALCGRWKGTMTQFFAGAESPVDTPIQLQFRKSGKAMIGTITFASPEDDSTVRLDLSGGFIDDHYIRFDYSDSDPSIIRYGLFLCEIAPEPIKLSGRFLGYSATAGGITYGHGSADRVG